MIPVHDMLTVVSACNTLYMSDTVQGDSILGLCLGSWCLTPLSTIFQLYRGGQFYWWRKPEYSGKTTELSHLIVNIKYLAIY